MVTWNYSSPARATKRSGQANNDALDGLLDCRVAAQTEAPLTGCRAYPFRRIQDQDSDSRGGNAGRFHRRHLAFPVTACHRPFGAGAKPVAALGKQKRPLSQHWILIFKA